MENSQLDANAYEYLSEVALCSTISLALIVIGAAVVMNRAGFAGAVHRSESAVLNMALDELGGASAGRHK